MATPWRFPLLALTLASLALPLQAAFKSGDSELPSGARMGSDQYLRSPKGEWALVITQTKEKLYVRFAVRRGHQDRQLEYEVPRLCLFRHRQNDWTFAGYVDSGPDIGKWFSESQKDQLKPTCFLNMADRGEVELFMNLGVAAHTEFNSDGDAYPFPDEPHPKKVWGAVGNQAGTKLVLTEAGVLKTLVPTNPGRTAWKEDGWRQGPFLKQTPKDAPKAPGILAKVE